MSQETRTPVRLEGGPYDGAYFASTDVEERDALRIRELIKPHIYLYTGIGSSIDVEPQSVIHVYSGKRWTGGPNEILNFHYIGTDHG